MSLSRKSVLTVFLVLLIDQIVKLWIKSNMFLYQDIVVFNDWFIIKFIENNGMAFGINLPGDYGKILLTLFRILAAIGIIYYLRILIRQKATSGLIITISLILAGAIGNIIDSAFYGMIFSESTPYSKAVLFPEGGGYAGFLHGKVVDMFYFPIIRTTWPNWIPIMGGKSFEFFRPIFNVADSAITIGVISILLFQKKLFRNQPKRKESII